MAKPIYHWNRALTSILQLQLASGKKTWKTGASCVYVPLTNCVGAKLYYEKWERDQAYYNHSKALDANIAPQFGQKFLINFPCFGEQTSDIGFQHFYGYLTQIAVTKSQRWWDRSDREDMMAKLCDQIDAIGLGRCDICYANVGFVDHRLVCIDFDAGSH